MVGDVSGGFCGAGFGGGVWGLMAWIFSPRRVRLVHGSIVRFLLGFGKGIVLDFFWRGVGGSGRVRRNNFKHQGTEDAKDHEGRFCGTMRA